MNNETNNNVTNNTVIDEQQKMADEVFMPGIPSYLKDEHIQEQASEQPATDAQTTKKKNNKKMLIILLAVLGVVVIVSLISLFTSQDTPSIPINIGPTDVNEKINEIKEEALTSLKEKSAVIREVITEVGSKNYELASLNYDLFELNIKNINNYDISLTSSDSLLTFYIRYYNMEYHYVNLESLTRYDKLYLVVINSSTINSYNYQVNLNTKKTYDLTEYNNYAIKIGYTASSGDVSTLEQINALYDEAHQRKYIRIPVQIVNIGNATKIVYEDVKTGNRYTKSPTSIAWLKESISSPKFNLKTLDQYIKSDAEGIKKLSNSVYKLTIKKEQILPILYGIEPLDEANATVTFTNDKISKIVYEFGNNIEGFENLVMTIEISDVNSSGDIVIPDEVYK